jgi:hypothetical protein
MKLKLAVAALLFAGLSAGFSLCRNVVHYRTWDFVPPEGFQDFEAASDARTVPLAMLLGLPSLAFAVLAARGGLPGVSRAPLWAAAGLAALPWVAAPTARLPIQTRLTNRGLTPVLVSNLALADLLLRTLPPVAQAGIQFWALASALSGGAVRRRADSPAEQLPPAGEGNVPPPAPRARGGVPTPSGPAPAPVGVLFFPPVFRPFEDAGLVALLLAQSLDGAPSQPGAAPAARQDAVPASPVPPSHAGRKRDMPQ